MTEWRASGIILAKRRDRGALRLAIKTSDLHFMGLHAVGPRLIPCVCRDRALVICLARMVQRRDLIRVSGTIEHCARPNNPIIKHDLELRVRAASAPRRLNRLRQLLRLDI
ncbi:MAG TPA: hypothetical protein PKY87_06790 [Terricaulis sp.]|nr:hypothetical protein [Terricaulis sp.]